MIETTGNRKMQTHTTDKPFNITKKQVYEAYKAVKSNAGSAGVDGQTIEQFDSDLRSRSAHWCSDCVLLVPGPPGSPQVAPFLGTGRRCEHLTWPLCRSFPAKWDQRNKHK
jgi:hypothetical protein